MKVYVDSRAWKCTAPEFLQVTGIRAGGGDPRYTRNISPEQLKNLRYTTQWSADHNYTILILIRIPIKQPVYYIECCSPDIVSRISWQSLPCLCQFIVLNLKFLWRPWEWPEWWSWGWIRTHHLPWITKVESANLAQKSPVKTAGLNGHVFIVCYDP